MTIKPRYRRRPSEQHWGYELTVSLSMPAEDMRTLISAAQIGFKVLAEGCSREGLPKQEPAWRAKEKAALVAHEEIERQMEAVEQKRPKHEL